MRDLFLALQDDDNAHKHPLLMVLLYTYCPRMVRWWVSGVEAKLPPDPVWMALDDMSAGHNLRSALIERGLDTALREAYRYVSTVDSFRKNHPGLDAPEVTSIFETMYDQQRARRDFQLSSRVEKEFGSWDGFYSYVRTHAFLFEDWARDVGFEVQSASVEAVTLSLRFTGISRLPPVRWPAWLWRGEGAPREVVSAIAFDGQQDVLRLSLLDKADRVEGSWAGVPDTYSLNPKNGEATPFVSPTDKRLITTSVVQYYHEAIKSGPHPPLAAYTAPSRCAACGFRHTCYKNDGTLQEEMLLE